MPYCIICYGRMCSGPLFKNPCMLNPVAKTPTLPRSQVSFLPSNFHSVVTVITGQTRIYIFLADICPEYDFDDFATLALSWISAIADNLASLSLQDRDTE